MRKTLRNVVTIGALGLATAGCNGNHYMRNQAPVDGYNVSVTLNRMGRNISIVDTSFKSAFQYLFGRDNDKDGRFDEIILNRIPEGHSLEAYANLDSLEAMWKRVAVKQAQAGGKK